MAGTARILDASFVARAILPGADQDRALAWIARWTSESRRLASPATCLVEVLSAIRQHVYAGTLSEEQARETSESLFDLPLDLVVPDSSLGSSALEWAEKLGHSKVYDAVYVALAQREGAELWTADRRLKRRADQIGASWVVDLSSEASASR